jgi:nucleoside-diphosphate-sugar epimerase
MNIMVTGANGFVGLSLCKSLIKNHHVTGIVRAKNLKFIASNVFTKELSADTDFSDSL